MNISYPLTNFQRTIVANNNNKKRKRDTREKKLRPITNYVTFSFSSQRSSETFKTIIILASVEISCS